MRVPPFTYKCSGLTTARRAADSVFVYFDQMSMADAEAAAVKLAAFCTGLFPNPMELEHEKTSAPTIFQNVKKRYAMNIGGKIEIKGLALKRRDNFGFRRSLESGLLQRLLTGEAAGRRERAEGFVREQLLRLARGQVPIEDLLLNKSLTRPLHAYKDAKLAHIVAARKYQAETGRTLESGDRFDILFVAFPDDAARDTRKASERAMHIALVLKHDRKPCLTRYLALCENTVCQLLGLFYMEQERRAVRPVQLLSGRVLRPGSLQSLKEAKQLHMNSTQYHKGFGYETARRAFFERLPFVNLAARGATVFGRRPERCPACEAAPCACTPESRKRRREELLEEIEALHRPYKAQWHGDVNDERTVIPFEDRASVCALNRKRLALRALARHA